MAGTATQKSTETPSKANWGRARLKAEGRRKRKARLANPEFAKTFFEGKSKRATDKKAAFRKKKARKK